MGYVVNVLFGVFLRDVLSLVLESADRLVAGLMGHHIVVSVLSLDGDVLSPLFRHVVSVALLDRLVLVVDSALWSRGSIGVPHLAMVGSLVAVV